jgi:MPBQ/MSBQ methyltransferase
VRRHGLIMGCSVTGVKATAGASPLNLGPIAEERAVPKQNPLSFLLRLFLGTTAGFYYTLVPIYMWIKNLAVPKSWAI